MNNKSDPDEEPRRRQAGRPFPMKGVLMPRPMLPKPKEIAEIASLLKEQGCGNGVIQVSKEGDVTIKWDKCTGETTPPYQSDYDAWKGRNNAT